MSVRFKLEGEDVVIHVDDGSTVRNVTINGKTCHLEVGKRARWWVAPVVFSGVLLLAALFLMALEGMR